MNIFEQIKQWHDEYDPTNEEHIQSASKGYGNLVILVLIILLIIIL
jgi:hypothetical protein